MVFEKGLASLPPTRQVVGKHKTVPTRGATSLQERTWDSQRMDVWGGAMVCSTRLILGQPGLTCCCRSQELLSLLGGGGEAAWESTSTDSEAQQALFPPPLRVNRWPSRRECTVMARDREGLKSGVVWAARPRHPHAHLFPGRQYRHQHALPLGQLRYQYTEHQAPQAVVCGLSSKIPACITTKRASTPP